MTERDKRYLKGKIDIYGIEFIQNPACVQDISQSMLAIANRRRPMLLIMFYCSRNISIKERGKLGKINKTLKIM